MRVSFVVPTRNQAPFIRTCLDSILAQEVEDAEVIVVDGCSTDGTKDILASYGDRIRFVSEPDRGQSDALNKAIRMATGDIVAWLNSDDYYPNGQILSKVLARFTDDVDVVYGDGLLVDVAHHPIRALRARPKLTARRFLLYRGLCVSQPSVFFRRQLYLEVGGVDEQLHFTMDYELWLRLFDRAREVVHLPELLSYAVSHAGAKTVKSMLPQIAEIVRIKLRYARRLSLSPIERAELWAGLASLYVYWAAVRVGWKRAV